MSEESRLRGDGGGDEDGGEVCRVGAWKDHQIHHVVDGGRLRCSVPRLVHILHYRSLSLWH